MTFYYFLLYIYIKTTSCSRIKEKGKWGDDVLNMRIKQLREAKGIPQAELAKIIGVSQQTVGSWESDRTEPDTKMLIKLAQFFNVTVDSLLGLPTPNQPEKPDSSPKETALAERLKNASPDTQKAIDLLLNADEISTKSDKKVTPFA